MAAPSHVSQAEVASPRTAPGTPPPPPPVRREGALLGRRPLFSPRPPTQRRSREKRFHGYGAGGRSVGRHGRGSLRLRLRLRRRSRGRAADAAGGEPALRREPGGPGGGGGGQPLRPAQPRPARSPPGAAPAEGPGGEPRRRRRRRRQQQQRRRGRGPPEGGGGKKGPPLAPRRRFSGNGVEDEDDEDSSESDSDDDDEDDEDDDEDEEGGHGAPLEGAYNSADYDYLQVSLEVKELFQYIRRYSAQMIDLEHKLKPFIPDFIPAVGDIDAFLKVPRPDGKADHLGLLALDEPSTKQSDPTVLTLWLTENSKQHSVAQVKVKSLENAEKHPKAIDSWIENISELHRCKPPATVHYTRPMPDIDTLMQEWSPEFEELLGRVSLPTADMDCSLAEYADMICAVLDIPVYKGHIQPLHTLFLLYSEFKNSQHFKVLAEGKKAASPPSNPPSQAGDSEFLSFT